MGFKIGDRVYHYAFGISVITGTHVDYIDNITEFIINKENSESYIKVLPEDIYKLEIGEYVVNKLTNKIGKIKNVHICNKSLLVVYDGNRSEYLNFDDVRGLDKNEELEVNKMCFNVGDYVIHSMYGFGKVNKLAEYPDKGIWVIFEHPLVAERNVSPLYMRLAKEQEINDYHKRNIKSKLNSYYGLAISKDRFTNNIFEDMSKYQYRKLPKIDKVIFNDPATIIFWKDGTKTVVKCHDRDYFDKEKGFAMACLKKVLGNCGHYYEEVKKWVQ